MISMIITINEREIYSPSPSIFGLRLKCGSVWLTENGSGKDYVLARGDEVFLGLDQKIVVEALGGTASLELLSAREMLCKKRRPLRSCA